MKFYPPAAQASTPKPSTPVSYGFGTALVLIGVLLIFLSVGESIAKAEDGSGGDVLRGAGEGERISGNSGNGNDRMYGLSGNDELYGGPGRDVLIGGGGNDFVEARDGREDYVDCGGGHEDVASVDDEDYVSADCETVYRG